MAKNPYNVQRNGNSKSRSIAILVAAVLLVIIWHLLALAGRPRHLVGIVDELGSIGRFLGDPLPNSDGTRLLFIRTTERGYGVYLCRLPNGPRKLLFEHPQPGSGFGDLEEMLLGWSPDDKWVAYCRRVGQWEVVICDSDTGATQAVMPVGDPVSAAVWLSPQDLVFVDNQRIFYSIRQVRGQWLRPLPFKYFRDKSHRLANDRIEDLAVLGADTVLWRQGDTILKCGENWDAPLTLAPKAAALKSATTATMDNGLANTQSTWYERGFNKLAPDTGLPTHGATFESQSSPDHSYAMAPDYRTNNAVLIDSVTTNGTLRLRVPTAFSKLSFLIASGLGDTRVGYSFHHIDGTVETGTFVAPDWFSHSSAAFVVNGRVSVTTGDFEAIDSAYPRLYSVDIALTNKAGIIDQIDLAYVSGAGHAAIFSVSGATNHAFAPISVNGYNADIIVETGAGITTASIEAGVQNTGFTWYEAGYNELAPGTGLPAHGSTFKSQSSPDHAYTMAPDYKTNNAVLIDSVITNGALALKLPAVFSKLSFLVAAALGDTGVGYAVHHADRTTEVGTFTAPDWFSRSNAALIANGRASTSGGYGKVNSDDPRLYSADITLANTSSPVTCIDFAYVSGNPHAAIFAVSGATNGTFTPITVTGYNADLILEASRDSFLSSAERMSLNRYHKVEAKRGKFSVARLGDEPQGIWRYDTSQGSPECVVPNVEKRFRYSRIYPIEEGTLANSAGEKLTYYLISPIPQLPNPSTRQSIRAHPLVLGILGIGELGLDWSANHQAIANCGAWFVTVDRRGRDYTKWADDLLAVYDVLAKRPGIDTNNVYLYGDSAGTPSVYTLLEERPQLWRGAVLFSPVSLPNPTRFPRKRLFFDCGGSDQDLAVRAPEFQDAAAGMGIPVTLLVHPGLGHTFRVPHVERERMREALIFLAGK